MRDGRAAGGAPGENPTCQSENPNSQSENPNRRTNPWQ